MTEKTLERQVQKLVDELSTHPHRQEIMELMQEQLLDEQTTDYAKQNCS